MIWSRGLVTEKEIEIAEDNSVKKEIRERKKYLGKNIFGAEDTTEKKIKMVHRIIKKRRVVGRIHRISQ